jgi:hypothetical protein
MPDFLHTSSWMVYRPTSVKSLGRYEDIVLFDRPQKIPRGDASGRVTQVTTPTAWRRTFLWWPTRGIQVQRDGTILEGWAWLKRAEVRTHYGSRPSESVAELRFGAAGPGALVNG